MKKKLLVIMLCISMLLSIGCGYSLKYGDDNVETNSNGYMLTRIPNSDVPDG